MNCARIVWRRRGVSRGQALIELTLFFVLLVTMVLGSTDIATLLDDHLNLVYAARTGARVGAVMGTNQYADCATIGAIQAALASDHNITLNQIVIYQSSLSGTTTGAKEVYPGNTTCNSTSPNSGALSNPPSVNTWPANIRDVTPFTEQSVGVELDYTYTFQFEPLGSGSFTAADYAVMPLEVVINQNVTPTPTP